jgi:pyranose oxidase
MTEHSDLPVQRYKDIDVLIIGAGPLGSTFARELVPENAEQEKKTKIHRVMMIDAGPQLSKVPGWHLKNSFVYQRDFNSFTGVIASHLHDYSVPTSENPTITLDPSAFHVDLTKPEYKGFVRNNQNPRQNPFTNIDGEAEAYCVGGMAVHWTCCIPRENTYTERSSLLSDPEWDALYTRAEEYLCLHKNVFDDSIRHHVVKNTMTEQFPGRGVDNLPLAVQANKDVPSLVKWSGTDVILGDKLQEYIRTGDKRFTLLPEHVCYHLRLSEDEKSVHMAQCTNLTNGQKVVIYAKKFVICCGAVRTPQLLHVSGIRSRSLGHYLCEQPKSFCQIVLKEEIVQKIGNKSFMGLTPGMKKAIEDQLDQHPCDPIPIPTDDKAPQVYIPFSREHPYHCQIHRDAFKYGAVPPNIDDRLIVDLRWFGYMDPNYENRVEFEPDIQDRFGMPQPTFYFKLSDTDATRAHDMIDDMTRAAVALGGFLPGSEPRFMAIGSSLHLTGSVRMGAKRETDDSVCDSYCKVWGMANLWLGTNGVIPTGTACNVTLTSVALAIRAARNMMGLPDLSRDL